MKKTQKTVSNPEELNKYLQHTSSTTWIVLAVVVGLLASFFVWSFVYKLPVKLYGNAKVTSGDIALNVKEDSLSKLSVGQQVYISYKDGTVLETKIEKIDETSKQPIVSSITIADGDYPYYILIGMIKPIDFLVM